MIRKKHTPLLKVLLMETQPGIQMEEKWHTQHEPIPAILCNSLQLHNRM